MQSVSSHSYAMRFCGNTPTPSRRVSEDRKSGRNQGSDEAILGSRQAKPKVEPATRTQKTSNLASKTGEFAVKVLKGAAEGMARPFGGIPSSVNPR